MHTHLHTYIHTCVGVATSCSSNIVGMNSCTYIQCMLELGSAFPRQLTSLVSRLHFSCPPDIFLLGETETTSTSRLRTHPDYCPLTTFAKAIAHKVLQPQPHFLFWPQSYTQVIFDRTSLVPRPCILVWEQDYTEAAHIALVRDTAVAEPLCIMHNLSEVAN